MTKYVNWFIFFISFRLRFFWPERSEYFSPGHSFKRNDGNDALGEESKMKTVRLMKIKKALNFHRTELLHNNAKETIIQLFRPKQKLHTEERIDADDLCSSHFTQGVALGYYNFSLSGKEMILIPGLFKP